MRQPDPNYWRNLRAKAAANYKAKQIAKPIRKVSDKHAKQLRVYQKNKAEFLENIEHCQFPGCGVVNVTLHHMEGRIGDRLTDQSKFKALCWAHHEWCEMNPEEAKAMGLSLNRL